VKIPSSLVLWIPLGLSGIFVCYGLAAALVRWLRLRRSPREEPGDILLGAVSRSLAERGELAASLGELRTVHEKLVDALPFGLLWVDQKRRVAALNGVGQGLLGVKRGVLGLDVDFVLEPYPWILEALQRPSGESWRCDGGGRRWLFRRIEAPDKVGSLLQFEDITEREAEERRQQLRERFAELGEMTAGVAHQLKNGLAVLKGHGQLLERAGHGDCARELLVETEDLERLVQRFLLWAKPLDPQCSDVNLSEAAAQAVAELRRRPLAQGLNLMVEGQGFAKGDPMLLHQALVNLLENACQASPAGATVKIRLADDRIEIEDQGSGFSEDTLVRMLRPFESGRPDGTGLGLPLALKWLNAQGADLHLESRPSGGTLVVICW
jgi:signal transduction histidine kinase